MSASKDTYLDTLAYSDEVAATAPDNDQYSAITPRRAANAAPVAYLLPEQKADILRLTARARAEGLMATPRFTALMLGINRLNEAEADDELAKLHQLVGHLPAEDVRVILDRHFAGRAMLTTTALNTAR